GQNSKAEPQNLKLRSQGDMPARQARCTSLLSPDLARNPDIF
ncbi:hypothetical protein A2U01_0031316, partial [Trifolium medium]|nr:hypothetical protein [Trifolium medium]